MAITKGELRTHFEEKMKRLKAEINKELNEHIDSVLDPILSPLFPEADEVRRMGEAFIAKYEAFLEKYNMDSYDLKNVIWELRNRAFEADRRRRNTIRRNAKSAIQHPTVFFDCEDERLKGMVAVLQKWAEPKYKRLDELNTLASEIENVIASESSGNRAYKALCALGIHMDDFEEGTHTNLPAVVKFSVDVCIVNGGC